MLLLEGLQRRGMLLLLLLRLSSFGRQRCLVLLLEGLQRCGMLLLLPLYLSSFGRQRRLMLLLEGLQRCGMLLLLLLYLSSFGRQRSLVLLAEGFEFILQLEPRGSLPPFGFTPFALCFGGGLLTGVRSGTNRRDLGGACSRGRGWFVRAVHLDGPRLAAVVQTV